jgi:hypothetical protein
MPDGMPDGFRLRREPLLRRILATVRGWFTPPPIDEPEPLPEPVYGVETYRIPTETYTVPAQGYVFDFQVRLAFTWTSDGLSPDSLAAWSRQFAPQVRREARCTIARCAREYLPHDVQTLDAHLAREFRHKVWEFVAGDAPITCRPHVRVRLAESVRAHLEHYWQERLAMEADHANRLRQAELVERAISGGWRLLDKLRIPRWPPRRPASPTGLRGCRQGDDAGTERTAEQLSRRMMEDYGTTPLADDSTVRQFVAGLFSNLGGDPDRRR